MDAFLWRAGDVNPLIDRVDTVEIRGLTSPARRTTAHCAPREEKLDVETWAHRQFSEEFRPPAAGEKAVRGTGSRVLATRRPQLNRKSGG